MKNFIFTLIVLALALPGKATTLSDKAEISVLTCSPGKELYSLFGHTAIRVHDPEQDLDVVFNYGTFDFDTPTPAIGFIATAKAFRPVAGKLQAGKPFVSL